MKWSTLINSAQCALLNTVLKEQYKETDKNGKTKYFSITNDDANVLDFIRDLFNKQSIEKIRVDYSEEDELVGMYFAWIGYKNMMEQLPLVNLGRDHIYEGNKIVKRQTYSKMCSERINRLIKLGLVYKITIKDDDGKGGEKVYLAPTELSEIIYEKVNSNDENIEEVVDKLFKGCLTKISNGCLIKTSNLYSKIKNKKVISLKGHKEKKKEKKEKSDEVKEVKKTLGSRVTDVELRRVIQEIKTECLKPSVVIDFTLNANNVDKNTMYELAYAKYLSIGAEKVKSLYLAYQAEQVKKKKSFIQPLHTWLGDYQEVQETSIKNKVYSQATVKKEEINYDEY